MLRIFYLFLISFLTMHSVQAQSTDKKTLLDAVDHLRIAMISGDTTVLSSLTQAALTYGHSNGAVQDKAAFIDALATGKSDFVTLEFTDMTVHISGNTAIVRHILTGDTNDSGVPGHVRLAVLQVWQKEHNQWTLLARQAAKLPVQ